MRTANRPDEKSKGRVGQVLLGQRAVRARRDQPETAGQGGQGAEEGVESHLGEDVDNIQKSDENIYDQYGKEMKKTSAQMHDDVVSTLKRISCWLPRSTATLKIKKSPTLASMF